MIFLDVTNLSNDMQLYMNLRIKPLKIITRYIADSYDYDFSNLIDLDKRFFERMRSINDALNR